MQRSADIQTFKQYTRQLLTLSRMPADYCDRCYRSEVSLYVRLSRSCTLHPAEAVGQDGMLFDGERDIRVGLRCNLE